MFRICFSGRSEATTETRLAQEIEKNKHPFKQLFL